MGLVKLPSGTLPCLLVPIAAFGGKAANQPEGDPLLLVLLASVGRQKPFLIQLKKQKVRVNASAPARPPRMMENVISGASGVPSAA